MSDFPINPTDLAVFGVLLVSGLMAFVRGFVKEVLAVAGWIGAILITIHLFPIVTPYARQYTDIQILADGATGIGIFVVSLVVLSFVSHFIAKRVRESSVSALDRSLGFVFGLARGAVLVAIAYLLLVWTVPYSDQPRVIREARVVPVVEQTARWLIRLVPAQTRKNIEQVLDRPLDTGASGTGTKPAAGQNDPDSQPETGYKAGVRKELEQILRAKPSGSVDQ
jgi:membrane protein required for colicin V production